MMVVGWVNDVDAGGGDGNGNSDGKRGEERNGGKKESERAKK